MGDVIINRPRKDNKQYGSNKIIQQYFNLFVQRSKFSQIYSGTAIKRKTDLLYGADRLFSHLLSMKNKNIILGIDPGTLFMGYAIIDATTSKPNMLIMDVLKMSSKSDAYDRLQKIHATVEGLIATHKPNNFAIEAPFYGKNVQSMLKLGRAHDPCSQTVHRCWARAVFLVCG